MLKITRLSDGETFTDAQDSLRQLWEDHYIVRSFSDDEEEDYSEVPGECYATYFSIQIADGKIEIAGWHEAEPCLPFELRPEEYTVTLGDCIPREEVRRVLVERSEQHFVKIPTYKGDGTAHYLLGRYHECRSIAVEFGIDWPQNQDEQSELSPLSPAEGEAKEARG